MVKGRTVGIVLCALMGVISCDESFDPHGEFVEQPVLYCVMEGSLLGPSSQQAVLMRTVPGREFLRPSDGFSSPVIRGARMTLNAGAQVVLTETLDTINIGTPDEQVQLTYRAVVSLKPVDFTSIRAELPDGRVLFASTRVPPYLSYDLSYRFPHGFTTAVNPLTRGETWTFSWVAPDDMLHFPELVLLYSVLRQDSTRAYRVRPIPQRLQSVGGNETATFPQPTYERSCGYEYSSIDSAFARLGREEGDYLQITIQSLRFTVVTFDAHLGRYYTSVHGGLDPYSIRIDERVYSNISGGIGVFGTYMTSEREIDVDREYAASFGYLRR